MGVKYSSSNSQDITSPINRNQLSLNDFSKSDRKDILSNAKKNANSRDAKLQSKYRDEIMGAIIQDERIEGSVYSKIGGSTSKHTYVEGSSDVDILLFINKSPSLMKKSPKEVRRLIGDILRDRLKNVKYIRTGRLAVTVVFNDGTEIQMIPAKKAKSGYNISKPDGKKWSSIIHTERFNRQLTRVNRKCDGHVIPVIKLIKLQNQNLPKSERMKGYHIEALAVKIFRNYPKSAPRTDEAMLKYYYENAKTEVRHPIKDVTGQSQYADGYAGNKNSSQRKKMSKNLNKHHSTFKNAQKTGETSELRASLQTGEAS